jgi:hypothetical protein
MKRPNHIYKSALSCILAVIVLLQLIVGLPLSDAQAAAAAGLFAETVNVTNTALLSGTRELKNGDSVAAGEPLLLRQTFTITTAHAQAILDNPNRTYSIPAPAGLRWRTDGNAVVTTPLFVNRTVQFATLSVTGGVGGTATITFTGDFWTGFEAGDFIEDGWLDISCELDAAAIGNRYEFDIDLGMPDLLELLFANNRPAQRFLDKTGEYVDNQFVWTIDYSPPGTNPPTALSFTDRFNHRVHTLIPESLPTWATHAVCSVDSDFTVITFNPPDAAARKWSYRTRLADESLITDSGSPVSGNTDATNRIEVFENGSDTFAAYATETVRISEEARQWTAKNGRQIPGTREMEWEVTINTNDRHLIDLVLYDKLPNWMDFIDGSIRINGGSYISATSLGNGTDFSFRLAVPRPSSGYLPEYVITYRTRIKDEYFDNPNLVRNGDNAAWLTFDWYRWGEYPGSPWTFTPPSVYRPVDTVTNAIAKRAVGYDRSSGRITWQIDVNPFAVDISGGVITDNLNNMTVTVNGADIPLAQAFVAGSLTHLSGVNLVASGDSLHGGGIITVPVGTLGTQQSSFTFQTQVPPDYHAANNGHEFKNTASFAFTIGDTPRNNTVTASVWAASQMLAKRGMGFGYNAAGQLVIDWQITVNQNNMTLPAGTHVIDTLPAGLTFVPTSLGGAANAVHDITHTVTNQVRFNLADNSTGTINFQTIVDTNHADWVTAFRTEPEVSAGNAATLHFGDATPSIPISATQRINNRLLNKTQTAGTGLNSGEFNYTVNINANGVILNNDVLIDTLPPNLRLDIRSVGLNRATIGADGTFTALTGAGNEWGFDATHEFTAGTPERVFSFDLQNRQFRITLPASGTACRFILSYICIPEPGVPPRGRLTNTISFDTPGFGDAGESDNTLAVGAGGGGVSNRFANVTLTLQDEERPSLRIGGVEFLVQRDLTAFGLGWVTEASVTTAANGQVTFSLERGEPYRLVQVNSIDGYPKETLGRHDSNIVNFTVGAADYATSSFQINAAASVVLTNKPNTGASFTFTARADTVTDTAAAPGDFAERLDGIQFTATSGIYTRTATSVAGGEVTFENLPHGTWVITPSVPLAYHTSPSLTVVVEPGTGSASNTTIVTAPDYADFVFHRPTITINKTGLAGAAQGVRFDLYDTANPAVSIANQTLTGDGAVTFGGIRLLGGHSYEVRETNPNDNFYQTGVFARTVTAATNITQAWTNVPHAAEITVNVSDSVRPDVSVAGAVFELRETPTGAAIATATSSASGTLLFPNLQLEQNLSALSISGVTLFPTTFYLVQTSSPDGYSHSTTPVPITLSGAHTASHTQNITNTPALAETSLTFTVQNTETPAEAIEGAVFRLKDNNSDFFIEAASNSSGVVTFTNIPHGTFTLTQTSAPAPYVAASGTVATITVHTDGVITHSDVPATVTNETSEAHIRITKVDASNSNAPLPNVGFRLYYGSTFIEEIPTDAAGVAEFRYLHPGRVYRIVELTPTGYVPTGDINITAVKDTTLNLTWYNHLIPTGSITLYTHENAFRGLGGTLVSGIGVTLYRGGTPELSAITNASGTAVFSGLDVAHSLSGLVGTNVNQTLTITDTHYTVRTASSPGYDFDTTAQIPFTFTASALVLNATHIAAPTLTDVAITNVNNWGIPLENGEFRLECLTTGSTFALQTAIGNSGGAVEFTGLPHGEYRLTQMTAPADHDGNLTEYTITVRRDGTFSTTITNDNFINDFSNISSVTVTFTHATTGQPLSGTFMIADSAGFFTHTINTTNGVAHFDGLMQGRDFTVTKLSDGFQSIAPDVPYNISDLCAAGYDIDLSATPIPPSSPSRPNRPSSPTTTTPPTTSDSPTTGGVPSATAPTAATASDSPTTATASDLPTAATASDSPPTSATVGSSPTTATASDSPTTATASGSPPTAATVGNSPTTAVTASGSPTTTTAPMTIPVSASTGGDYSAPEHDCECGCLGQQREWEDDYFGGTNQGGHENGGGNDENGGGTLSGDSNPTTGVGFSASVVVAAFAAVFAAKRRKTGG